MIGVALLGADHLTFEGEGGRGVCEKKKCCAKKFFHPLPPPQKPNGPPLTSSDFLTLENHASQLLPHYFARVSKHVRIL